MRQKHYSEIEKIVRANPNLSTAETTMKLIKKKLFADYSQLSRFDTLRRNVAFVKAFLNLKKPPTDKDAIIKEHNRLNKLYPNLSCIQIATKMQLKFNELSLATIRYYVVQYRRYGKLK